MSKTKAGVNSSILLIPLDIALPARYTERWWAAIIAAPDCSRFVANFERFFQAIRRMLI